MIGGFVTEGVGWLGWILGAVGALLLALNNAGSRHGFVCYLVSNACLLAYAWAQGTYPFVLLSLVLSAIGVVGMLCRFTPREQARRLDRIRFDIGSHARLAQAARELPWRSGR